MLRNIVIIIIINLSYVHKLTLNTDSGSCGIRCDVVAMAIIIIQNTRVPSTPSGRNISSIVYPMNNINIRIGVNSPHIGHRLISNLYINAIFAHTLGKSAGPLLSWLESAKDRGSQSHLALFLCMAGKPSGRASGLGWCPSLSGLSRRKTRLCGGFPRASGRSWSCRSAERLLRSSLSK